MTRPDSIRPEKAAEMYLTSREDEMTKKSLRNAASDLKRFQEWCDERSITDMNEIDGRMLAEFRTWRAEQVTLITLKHNLWSIKTFVRFCEQINAVPEGTSEKMVIPDTTDNDTFIEASDAEAILDYLERFEYASLRHAVFYMLWHTGMRSSSLLALDLEDFHSEENKLCVRYRPTNGTGLKSKERGERDVFLKDEVVTVLEDFVTETRADVLDENGRRPLFATTDTRVTRTTVQRMVYTATRPCHIGNECPHDRDVDTCEANSYNLACKCPSSLSPRPLRKGAITRSLNEQLPKDILTDRMDVSREILDKHYNEQSLEEQMEARREHLKDI